TYLINTAEILRLTANDPALSNEYNIARIWKVWLFHQLTDAYGDIPYFEAVNDAGEMIVQAKYDSQEDIYADMLKELKEASALLSDDASKLSFGDADILLKGNIDGWKKLANSLRLRLAIRVRYAKPALSQEHVTEALALPLIDDNIMNVALKTLDDGNTDNSNQLYNSNLVQPGNMIVSFTLTDNLKRLEDPRLPLLARPSAIPEAGYRGTPPQIFGDEKIRYSGDSVAMIAESFLQPVYNIIVMNAAEVKFLRAEAALAGLSSEDAQSLYTSGIQAAMEQYGVASGDINAYQSSASATLSGTEEEQLEQIIVQKWLSIYFNGNEGWAEFRRTGYPRIWTGSELGDTQGNIPRRFTYPTDEAFKNSQHLQEAIGRLTGGDKLTSRIWWDAKAGTPFPHPKQGIFPPE
ncbi:MAG: SusD/RagB family nutrient-binding outer membrane lipoprotein, partial [Flavitalea sp.]